MVIISLHTEYRQNKHKNRCYISGMTGSDNIGGRAATCNDTLGLDGNSDVYLLGIDDYHQKEGVNTHAAFATTTNICNCGRKDSSNSNTRTFPLEKSDIYVHLGHSVKPTEMR